MQVGKARLRETVKVQRKRGTETRAYLQALLSPMVERNPKVPIVAQTPFSNVLNRLNSTSSCFHVKCDPESV